MPLSDAPLNADSSAIASGLILDDELPSGSLLKQASLESGLDLSSSSSSEPVGEGALATESETLSPLEEQPFEPEEPSSLFPSQSSFPSSSGSGGTGSSTDQQQRLLEEAANSFDLLTGSETNSQLLGTATEADLLVTSSSLSTLTAETATAPAFAVVAEGRVTINGGGDFDGNPLDLSDDARIYAGDGFAFNQPPILPVQLDSQGNPVLDASGQPVLVENAVVVAAGFSVASAPDNPYANLLPPQEVAPLTVEVPAFADIRANELALRLPEGTPEIAFNPNQSPINTVEEFEANFPAGGTLENPAFIRVANGSLTIPDGVSISNAVIVVESGSITFNGSNQTLDNVVLLSEQRTVNLGNAQLNNSSVLAANNIRTGSGSRFSGQTLLANGNANSILNFNGATASINADDFLSVVAQGRLTFNGVVDTRAQLVAGGNVSFNSPSMLVGSILTRGNLTFNQSIEVSVEPASTPPPDTTAPIVTLELANDTGVDNSDTISNDPTIVVQATDDLGITSLEARFSSSSDPDFVDISTALTADSIQLDLDLLESINGDELVDGTLTLELQASDAAGNSSTTEFSFTLDRLAPTIGVYNPSGSANTFIDIFFNEVVTSENFNLEDIVLNQLVFTPDSSVQQIEITSIEQLGEAQFRINLSEAIPPDLYQLEIAPGVMDIAGNITETATGFVFESNAGLVEIFPFDGEEFVNPSREIIVRFNQEVDPSTVNEDSFFLIANGEKIPGNIVVSSTGIFATFFSDGLLPASTQIRVIVDGDKIETQSGELLDANNTGDPGGILSADFQTLSLTSIEGTDIVGYVLDSNNQNPDGSDIPIIGATITVDGLPGLVATTDESGFFRLEDVPAPATFIQIDGSTATNTPAGTFYATVTEFIETLPGQEVQLSREGEPFDIFLPLISEGDIQNLSLTETTNVGFGSAATAELIQLFPEVDPSIWELTQVEFAPGSARDDAGNIAVEALIVPVSPDRLPAPLPPGIDPQLVISIQAGGPQGFSVAGGATNFDTPAPITFPNLEGLEAGEKSLIYSFNHDAGRFDVIGTGTVSADGRTITSDPGVGILAPGWHFAISGTTNRFVIGFNPPDPTASGNELLFDDFPIQNGTLALSPFQLMTLQEVETAFPTVSALRGLLLSGLELAANPISFFTLDLIGGEINDLAEEFVDRFISGSQQEFVHNPGDFLSEQVRDARVFQNAVDSVVDRLNEIIQSQADQGFIDVNDMTIAIADTDIPEISFPSGNLIDSFALKALIGGTQGTLVSIEDFDADATVGTNAAFPGFGTYTATLRFEILDTFGVDETDLYEPPRSPAEALYAFWILQHQRIGPAPFTNRIVVEVPITQNFVVPAGFEEIIIEIDSGSSSASPPPNTQLPTTSSEISQTEDPSLALSSDESMEIIEPEFSTVAGFGDNHQVFFRYVIEGDLEVFGSINPDETLSNFTLGPDQDFIASFYQPSTNRSTQLTSVTNLSGVPTFFSNSPVGIGEADSIVDLNTFGGLDEDGDGIPDFGEFVLGTDPNNIDSDGDGISDAAELEQGLDPLDDRAFSTGIIASLPLLGEANAIVVEGSTEVAGGQTAYIATGSHGLAIVDASQFDTPIILGQLNLGGDATDVGIDSDLQIAAVATNDGGLQLIDVSDPVIPVGIQTLNLSASLVEVNDGVAYATVGNSLVSVDVFSGEILQTLSLSGSGSITGIARERDKLYAYLSGSDLFTIIDISTEGNAFVEGQVGVSIASFQVGVFVANGITYLAGSGLHTVDVSNPQNPVLISAADSPFVAQNVALNGSGIALTASASQGVGIFDITDPTNTNNTLFSVDTPGSVNDLAIASGIAYIADGTDGLQVINYLPFDNQGVAPTVALDVSTFDFAFNGTAFEVIEGSTIPVKIDTADDVQIRNVEVLINGEIVQNDVSFPFNESVIAPRITEASGEFILEVRATDTGGNIALSAPVVFQLLEDTTQLELLDLITPDGTVERVGPTTIQLKFSEPIDAATIGPSSIQLIDEQGNIVSPSDLQLRSDDRLIRLTFTPLLAGNYQLLINAPDITDRAGNPLGDNQIAEIFQILVDTFSPEIDNIFPSDGEIIPSLDTIVVEFSEDLDPTTVTTSTFQLFDSAGTLIDPISFELRDSNQVLLLSFEDLFDDEYQLIIDAPEVTDSFGNTLDDEEVVTAFLIGDFSGYYDSFD
ncbi:Ig-like domain-containing protein [Synechococcus sp. PCC 7336]|uniref:Ig-like domain-containing protein n=1 Tax=Synechococcus sp. PCC 7336 TaxID=195250 RepID=UPI000347F3F7|nr:Ig-like domain-containing protein [Synechococcus sp. PCC 7336]